LTVGELSVHVTYMSALLPGLALLLCEAAREHAQGLDEHHVVDHLHHVVVVTCIGTCGYNYRCILNTEKLGQYMIVKYFIYKLCFSEFELI